MSKNRALVIGINHYKFLQSLKYAQRDAQLMREFFCNEAGFERVDFFSDNSPEVNGKSTRPYLTNLRRVLRCLFEEPFMGAGDKFWFFFGGHGIRHNSQDYLIPKDGDLGDIEKSAISISEVTQQLRRCGADNVVLILDACRNQSTRAGAGIGLQTASVVKQQTGVISIFSCSPTEYSYEIDELQQGAFTFALLEGLRIKGQGATLEQLDGYLRSRVPEVVRQYKGKDAEQKPWIIAEPINKSHVILVSKSATSPDKEASPPSSTNQNSGSPNDTPNSSSLVENDKLSSEPNVNYTELRNLLEAKKWKEADKETYSIMLSVVRRSVERGSEKDWISGENILKFPCNVLCTIDRLWVEYSKGRFGFSVQKKIYLEVGGIPDGNIHKEAWEKFGDRVGWRVRSSWIFKTWIPYSKVTFNTVAPPGNSGDLPARKGHLPARAILRVAEDSEDGSRWHRVLKVFSRIQECKCCSQQ